MKRAVKTMTLKAFFTAALILVPVLWAGIPVFGESDISGYFENRFFLVENPAVNWRDLDEKFRIGDYNRLRLMYSVTPTEKVTVKLAVDFFSFHGFIRSPMGTYESPGEAVTGDRKEFTIDLDRAYVDLHFKKFDLSIGKQRVAFGVSYVWAPLDIFNRVNVLEPKEEKPGTNAIKAYVPLGLSSGITAVYSPQDRFKTSLAGIRINTHFGGIDAAVNLIRKGSTRTTIYGLDFRGENFVGWWLEGGYFVSPGNKDVKIVVGFDYTFPVETGIYWLNEFYYDSTGFRSPDQYDYSSFLTGDRFTLGRKYFMSMLRYGFSEFLQASVSYIGNWDDGSYFINPNISYEILQNVTVSTGFYIPMGKAGEFNRGQQGGKGSNTFFLWLKVNF